MADSVDRVFAHALNTVKRIPRLGSARPPPADRLKLYGLYKQSTEGDVDGVMERPRGEGDEVRSDQEKWDAWNYQKGLSKTEAKRQYIATLIETMHRYASQTADARELVAELEFVWNQIKSNPPSPSHSSNSRSYGSSRGRRGGGEASVATSHEQPIYPLMSERGSRNPKQVYDKNGLRVLSPVSQSQVEGDIPDDDDDEDEEDNEEDEDIEPEDFEEEVAVRDGETYVDAPDSQVAGADDIGSSPERERRPQPTRQISTRQQVGEAAGAFIAPLANYIRSQRQTKDTATDQNSKYLKKIEAAMIKMNVEVAALREQLEMQQMSGSMYSSILQPFRAPRRRGWLRWIFDSLLSLSVIIVRHVLIDAALLALLTWWMNYRGIPLETLEDWVLGWIQRIQRLALWRKLSRIQQRKFPMSVPKAMALIPGRTAGGSSAR